LSYSHVAKTAPTAKEHQATTGDDNGRVIFSSLTLFFCEEYGRIDWCRNKRRHGIATASRAVARP
jgi:hypothetical protein